VGVSFANKRILVAVNNRLRDGLIHPHTENNPHTQYTQQSHPIVHWFVHSAHHLPTDYELKITYIFNL
jgi:hypothetical protein